MSASQKQVLFAEVKKHVHTLLFADVIPNTYSVMTSLQRALNALCDLHITPEERQELVSLLENLTSESIREALHKGELGITNGIIMAKNRLIFADSVPESHLPIDPKNFPNYSW